MSQTTKGELFLRNQILNLQRVSQFLLPVNYQTIYEDGYILRIKRLVAY